jgi:hypothetical protein
LAPQLVAAVHPHAPVATLHTLAVEQVALELHVPKHSPDALQR